MFTGLVEYVGVIESLERSELGARIRVNAGPLAAGLAKSGSIAVNGCCLTAVEISDGSFAADLSGETLRRTSFGEMKAGTRVNLERPLTAMKELGGHFMQGHVDGVGTRALRRNEGLDRSRWHQPDRRKLARLHRRISNHPLHIQTHESVFTHGRRRGECRVRCPRKVRRASDGSAAGTCCVAAERRSPG